MTLSTLRKRVKALRSGRPFQHRVGMTLIEIMIVVTIMAAIMGVVGYYVIGFGDRANIKLAGTQLKKIKGAITAYRTENQNRFPDSLQTLTEGSAPFLEEIPADPWGNEYTYEQGSPTVLRSKGPDGNPNSDDDIVVEIK